MKTSFFVVSLFAVTLTTLSASPSRSSHALEGSLNPPLSPLRNRHQLDDLEIPVFSTSDCSALKRGEKIKRPFSLGNPKRDEQDIPLDVAADEEESTIRASEPKPSEFGLGDTTFKFVLFSEKAKEASEIEVETKRGEIVSYQVKQACGNGFGFSKPTEVISEIDPKAKERLTSIFEAAGFQFPDPDANLVAGKGGSGGSRGGSSRSGGGITRGGGARAGSARGGSTGISRGSSGMSRGGSSSKAPSSGKMGSPGKIDVPKKPSSSPSVKSPAVKAPSAVKAPTVKAPNVKAPEGMKRTESTKPSMSPKTNSANPSTPPVAKAPKPTPAPKKEYPKTAITQGPNKGKFEQMRGNNKYLLDENGKKLEKFDGKRTFKYNDKGKVAEIHDGNTVTKINGDLKSVYKNGKLHSEEKIINRGGKKVIQQSVVQNNKTVNHYYTRNQYGYRDYAPYVHYDPYFYGGFYRPWGHVSWGWGPYYWHDYYAPYPYYSSGLHWLTDSIMLSYLINLQRDANDRANANVRAAIDEATKEQIKNQVSIAMEKHKAQELPTLAEALRDPNHVYTVSEETEGTDQETGEERTLPPATLIRVISPPEPGDSTVWVRVESARKGQDLAKKVVEIPLEQLGQFHNDFNRRLEEGLTEMHDKNIGGSATPPKKSFFRRLWPF